MDFHRVKQSSDKHQSDRQIKETGRIQVSGAGAEIIDDRQEQDACRHGDKCSAFAQEEPLISVAPGSFIFFHRRPRFQIICPDFRGA